MNNMFKLSQILKANLNSRYSLQTEIPANTKIKDQLSTGACWAFAGIGMLETNLALQDKINSKGEIVYDFSERHMDYMTSANTFFNDAINPYGYYRRNLYGGIKEYALNYLTNGTGAILESSMQFEDNQDDINISEIQNKEVVTTVEEYIMFESPYNEETQQEVTNKVKQHITNYGGVWAAIHSISLKSGMCYNNSTGAVYCPEEDPNGEAHFQDHAVLIIGWDDNYDKNNFNEGYRPNNNGAWIIKNSYGVTMPLGMQELKDIYFIENTTQCENNGWDDYEEIPDEFIINNFDKITEILKRWYGENNVTRRENEFDIEVGDKGFWYVSYEDQNVLHGLCGIVRAENTKNYKNLYQNDILGPNQAVDFDSSSEDTYLANTFSRNPSVKEYINKISFYTDYGYECKVYINPNGSNKSDLQEVKLKSGDTQIVEPGYHTLEFAEPIELTGDSFTVAIKILGAYTIRISLEGIDEGRYKYAEVNKGESFVATESQAQANDWKDLSEYNELFKGNLCIKAFTIGDKDTVASLTDITVSKAPTKTTYIEGENFDRTGMKITATYSDGTSKEVTTYSIQDGNNLSEGQTNVKIRYQEGTIIKTTTQNITVNKKEEEKPEQPDKPDEPDKPKVVLSGIEVTKAPTKTVYTEGENFDRTGMEVTAKYSDNTTKKIINYNITDGNNLQEGKTSVTISYQEETIIKTTTQNITVNKKEEQQPEQPDKPDEPDKPKVVLSSIEVTKAPTKTVYTEGENFDRTGMEVTAKYSDNTTKKIINYNVTDGSNLSEGKTSITISYQEGTITKTATQNITVNKKQQPQPPQEENTKEPINSNFENTTANSNNIKFYFSTQNVNKITVKANINVSNIKIGDKEDTYTYYYYISSIQENKLLSSEWTKIEPIKESDGIYLLKIDINSDNITNYNELLGTDKLYLSIKEIA